MPGLGMEGGFVGSEFVCVLADDGGAAEFVSDCDRNGAFVPLPLIGALVLEAKTERAVRLTLASGSLRVTIPKS